MTKTFDEICNGILSEMVTAPNQQQKPNQNQPQQPGQQPAPGAGAPAAIQNNTQNNTPQQTTPDELTKAFETLNKHAANNQEHMKAIAALQQLLIAQQQNAAVKPA